MPLEKVNKSFENEVKKLTEEGRAKQPERVIVEVLPPDGTHGPRYKIKGSNKKYLRMNSNSYLDLSCHPELIRVADEATHLFGVGPGAVRFIDGTFQHHVALENDIASFTGKPAAKIFNSAYTSNLALALAITNKTTYWIGDELNHNSIIRAMRISNIPKGNRSIFKHNDMEELNKSLAEVPKGFTRVCLVFDGIFSMRGDYAPIREIQEIALCYQDIFEDGVITIVDDSHGIAAYGVTGRGTEEHTKTQADITVGTFGKSFGVNGGFISGSKELVELIRQKSDTYIYTNPLSVADCAASSASIRIVSSEEGQQRLSFLHERVHQFRKGLNELGLETINGPHPIVPILVRDTKKTHELVQKLFQWGILVVGLTFPVVPKGDETIRTQLNAGLTSRDIDYVLEAFQNALK